MQTDLHSVLKCLEPQFLRHLMLDPYSEAALVLICIKSHRGAECRSVKSALETCIGKTV